MMRTPGVLPVDQGKDKVLVVDDDLGQRAMMTRMLRKAGYQSSSAMSSDEARRLLETETYGMVVTDLRMWGENGLELVRHIADRYPGTYSIVMTGFVEDDVERQCLQAGAFAMMAKPLDMPSMVGVVASAFEEREATVALRRHQGHA